MPPRNPFAALRDDARFLRANVQRIRKSAIPALEAVERWMASERRSNAPQAAYTVVAAAAELRRVVASQP